MNVAPVTRQSLVVAPITYRAVAAIGTGLGFLPLYVLLLWVVLWAAPA